MSQYTAPTLAIETAAGTTYAYRRFGKEGGARLIVYPDPSHGFPFQRPHEFAAAVNTFLAA